MHFSKKHLTQALTATCLVVGIFAFTTLTTTLTKQLGAELPMDSAFAPHAALQMSQTAPIVNEEVTLDASDSRTADGTTTGLSYRFDFEGNYGWSEWQTQPTAKYTYVIEGYYPARVAVKDNTGRIDETTTGVLVYPYRNYDNPYAHFTVLPEKGDTDTNFRFDVENPVSKYNTPTREIEIRFDFNGDGVWDTDWSTARTFYYTFPELGSFSPKLELRDRNGDSRIIDGYRTPTQERNAFRSGGRILIAKSERPRASFRAFQQTGQPRMVYFDASATHFATEYRWDFDTDGTWDSTWMTDPRVMYEYKKSGTFTVLMQTRNARKRIDQTQRTVIVTEVSRIRPEADFTIRNLTNAVDNATGATRDTLSFSAAGSRDPATNGTAKLRVRWDFNSDSIWDTDFSNTLTTQHAYYDPGDYIVTVEVVNDAGYSTTYQKNVRIVENTIPTVYLRATPKVGTRDTEFSFSAALSDDGQNSGGQLQARFDFDSDGVWDTLFATNKVVRHRYEKPGIYTARVELRDAANTSSESRTHVEVVEPSVPVALFTVAPDAEGTFNTTYTFDASASYEPSGIGGPLQFRWDFSSHGINDIQFDTGWSTTPTTTHRYTQPGRHITHLAVKNNIGETHDYIHEILIHEDSAYTNYLKKLSLIKTENPDQLVTRGELATLVVQAKGIQINLVNSSVSRLFGGGQAKTLFVPRAGGGVRREVVTYRADDKIFPDVPPTRPDAPYIRAATERGWILPKANFRFDPDGRVTRAEATRAIVAALYPRVIEYTGQPYFIDVDPKNVALYRFAHIAYDEDIVPQSANHKFYPPQTLTQGEIARMTALMLEKYWTQNYRISSLQNLFASVLDAVVKR